ncbi:MAG: HAMP domain-containing histidine kinase [Acidobacteria bacterium]|nr:HAMP domain-containing histidine kinase [Acidobacteriota bacterium]
MTTTPLPAAFIDLYKSIELALILILLVLVILVFRRLFQLRHEVKDKKEFLTRLEDEIRLKENIQIRAFAAIAEIEEAAPRLRDLFTDIGGILKVRTGILVFRDTVTGILNCYAFPEERALPEKLFSWLESMFSQGRKTVPIPYHPEPSDLKDCFQDIEPDDLKLASALPIFQRGILVGGTLFFSSSAEEIDRRKNDFCRVNEIFAAIVSYRSLQNEIAQSVEEANTVSSFLAKIVVLNDMERMFDAIYEFFRDNYSQSSVSILLLDQNLATFPKKGLPIEEKLLGQLIPLATEEFRQGHHILYFPDQNSLAKRFSSLPKPENIQSMLIAPLMVFSEVFGFVVFESKKLNPFKVNRLSTLIRLVEISSFLLKKNLYFQKEIERRQEDADKFRQELTRQTVVLQDRENTIRELSDFNSVFGMVQAVKGSLASLKGFLTLLEENSKEVLGPRYDPVFLRNCAFEVDKIERSIRKFELVRIVTEPDFTFRPTSEDPMVLFDQVFTAIRQRSKLKHVDFETTIEAEGCRVQVDTQMLVTALTQFFERVLDFIADGHIQNVGQIKDNQLQIVSRFVPQNDPQATFSGAAFLSESFRSDFNYVVLSRLLSRHKGKLDLEVFYERGFVLAMMLPVTPAPL